MITTGRSSPFDDAARTTTPTRRATPRRRRRAASEARGVAREPPRAVSRLRLGRGAPRPQIEPRRERERPASRVARAVEPRRDAIDHGTGDDVRVDDVRALARAGGREQRPRGGAVRARVLREASDERGARAEAARSREDARRRVRALQRGHVRVRQDVLPRHEAHDPGEAARDLGHLRLVPQDGRARGRTQREPHHPGGAESVGSASGGGFRRAPRGRDRRRAVRHRVQVSGGHPAVPRHGGRDEDGPREAAVRDVRRAVRVLLPRRGHRRADVHAHHGVRRELRGRPQEGVQGCAVARTREPAHEHPARRRRGRHHAEQDIHPPGGAPTVWHRRERGDQVLARGRGDGRGGPAVEGVHEVPDRARARGVRGSGGGGELPPQRRALAGVVRAGRVPEHPRRHRGERLRQLHATRVRAQVAEVFDASCGVQQGAARDDDVSDAGGASVGR
mmetsp:Transcript_4431/g.15661  ORF Transcript_4431/g.15661 Transcript_4431/m.15661 type:complete len:450 (+) Transcript_4431:628-1977(+)